MTRDNVLWRILRNEASSPQEAVLRYRWVPRDARVSYKVMGERVMSGKAAKFLKRRKIAGLAA